MECLYSQEKKTILCAGTMNSLIRIFSRSARPLTYAESQGSHEINLVQEVQGYFEEIRASRRFDGVVVNREETHISYIRYDDTIFELDLGTIYVEVEGVTRSRYFRPVRISNYKEQNDYIALFMRERGFSDLWAAEA